MADNLRRSLSAPATLATLVAACALSGVGARRWTAFVLAVSLLTPTALSFFTSLLPKSRGVAKRSFVRGVVADLATGLAQTALRIVLLAHASWLRVDAIARALWRLTVNSAGTCWSGSRRPRRIVPWI